jgi:glycosyltransferase involved in cell wall biosynthesis
VAASKILNDKFPDFKVLFTFKEDNAVKEIVREAEGTKQIVFTGYLPREKILELYNDYALIWASSMESYPIPFAEAMALKDIIIAPDEDYALEILKSYNNAIFYNKNDAGALAEAMNTALKLNQNAANVSELRVEYNTWNDVLDLMVMH